MAKSWFRAEHQPDATAVYIYDEIGMFGVTAKMFQRALADNGASEKSTPLDVFINSPGGDVFTGIAIHNILSRYDRVRVHVDGLAASIASVIAMAGQEIIMPENAMMMIHNPWGVVAGDADELRGTADVLEKVQSQIAGIYAAKTGRSVDQCLADMNAETWLTGAEAVELGYADSLSRAVLLNACCDLSKFKNFPEKVRNAFTGKQADAGLIAALTSISNHLKTL